MQQESHRKVPIMESLAEAGRILRRLREVRGWSQFRLAAELERQAKRAGRSLASRESLVRMVRMWEAGTHRPRDYYALFILVYATDEELVSRAVASGSDLGRLMEALDLMGVPMDRRTFLLDSAALALGLAMEQPHPRLSLLDLFDDDPVSHAAVRLDHLLGLQWSGEWAPRVYKLLLRHAGDLQDFIDRLPESDVRRDLRTVQARTYWMAGSAAFLDLGNHIAAEEHLRAGNQAAKWSSDPRLRAQVCIKLAQRRLYDRRPDTETLLHEALWILESAGKYSEGSPFVLANLLGNKAEIYAALGSEAGFSESLDRATREIESASPDDAPVWLAGFNASRIEGYAGACWLRLGNAKRAAKELDRALNGGGFDRSHEVVVFADAARALALLSEPEHAVSLLRRAIPLAARQQGVVRAERIRDARASLNRWNREMFVGELDEQMRAAGISA